METPLVINFQEVIEKLLQEMYYNEFEVIDGLNQHPHGITFYEWLYQHHYITADNLTAIEFEIAQEGKPDPEYD